MRDAFIAADLDNNGALDKNLVREERLAWALVGGAVGGEYFDDGDTADMGLDNGDTADKGFDDGDTADKGLDDGDTADKVVLVVEVLLVMTVLMS